MPRIARPVFAGIPHHITQRGNRREDVFFSDADRTAYLAWLRDYSAKYGVQVLAYCLMTNHVHIVATPKKADALEKVFRALHTRYAQRINRAKQWKGYVWQGRFFSSALDEAYLWAAIRYVERNPVRAKMVRKAENYRWSSAQPHCGLRQDPVLNTDRAWLAQLRSMGDWSTWLAQGDQPEQLEVLRRHVGRGLPCGAEGFLRRLERRAGKMLRLRARGRPKKVERKE
jgi:putative transposase